MKERDKYLTEAMGQCWHEPPGTPIHTEHGLVMCSKCHQWCSIVANECPIPKNNNFSTWDGFGILWEWIIKQSWYWHFDCYLMYAPSGHEFTPNDSDGYLHKNYLDPDKFANAVYKYLKGKN